MVPRWEKDLPPTTRSQVALGNEHKVIGIDDAMASRRAYGTSVVMIAVVLSVKVASQLSSPWLRMISLGIGWLLVSEGCVEFLDQTAKLGGVLVR